MREVLNATPEAQRKALAVTGAFEGHGDGTPAGNFDGQILSWGPLGYNLGQGTLQPVLRALVDRAPGAVEAIMGREFTEAVRQKATASFVRERVLDPEHPQRVRVEWRSRWRVLAGTDVAKAIFAEAATPYLWRAERVATQYAWVSERAYCLAFDIVVQNGSVRPRAHARYTENPESSEPEEWRRLKAMALAVAEASLPQWQADVRSRKLAIAVGQGTVHGRAYHLERDFGVRYTHPWRAA
jgi:hypothetical protein